MSESSGQDIKNERMGILIVGRYASHFNHLNNSYHYSQGEIYFKHVETFTFSLSLRPQMNVLYSVGNNLTNCITTTIDGKDVQDSDAPGKKSFTVKCSVLIGQNTVIL